MSRYYFNADTIDRFPADSWECYTLSWHREEMRLDELSSLRLYPALPSLDKDVFWCAMHVEYGHRGEATCGLVCDRYAPRNGRNGRCRHHRATYRPDTEHPLIIHAAHP